MKTVEDVIKIFEQIVSEVYPVKYGFNTDAPAPVVKYELTINDGGDTRTVLLEANFEMLVVTVVKRNLITTHLELYKNLTTIKQKLVEAGFVFKSIQDAIELDGKGNVTDNPAKVMNFTHIVQFD